MSETEMLRALAGSQSEKAFSEFVRRYAGLVYSTAKRRLANPSLAEDITQMVFIRFAKNQPKVQTHAELAAWLHRTTVNISIDLWRSETRRHARELQAVVMEPPATDTVVWEEISPKLDEALNQLNDEDRHALLLRFFSRKTMREIGTMLGISEDAAKMRVSRAVDRLRSQMGATATACTAAVLSTLLIERSVEAAPAPLVTRLSAIKLSTAAGLGIGGFVLRIAKSKLAVGAAVMILFAIIAVHVVKSGNSSSLSTADVNSQPDEVAVQTTNTNPSQSNSISSPSRFKPAASPAPVMLFHVFDAETAKPLSGTIIHAVSFGIGGNGKKHDFFTDKDGTAEILIPSNTTMNAFVVAEGHVPKVVGFLGSMPADYTIRLNPAMMAGGIVKDEEGRPVAQAKVFIDTPGITVTNMDQKEHIDFQTCPATTDSNGVWNCSYVPLDYTNEITFIVKKKNYLTTTLIAPVAGKNLNNLELMIKNGSTVTGQITDDQDQPIVNAHVTTIDDDMNTVSAKSDDNGSFILKGVRNAERFYSDAAFGSPFHNMHGNEPISASIAVEAIGFAPQTAIVNLSATTNVINFTLSPSRIFRGHVVDEMGHPIPNAIVQTDWNNQGLRAFDWHTITDIDGGFEWDSAPVEPTLYWIEADGYQAKRDVLLVADTSDHEIILKKAAP